MENKKKKAFANKRPSEIIGFPKVQTSSLLSQLSVKKCMCELGDFYIFHELLVAGGTEKRIFFATSLLCNFLRDTQLAAAAKHIVSAVAL